MIITAPILNVNRTVAIFIMISIGSMSYGGGPNFYRESRLDSSSSYQCKVHNEIDRMLVGSSVYTKSATATLTQRPPKQQERDQSSSRSPKSSKGGVFEVEFRNVSKNPSESLSGFSSPLPGSPAQQRRGEPRRAFGESPRRQVPPPNPGTMTRKTAVTPRASRKATVTEVKTDRARIVQQTQSRPTALPKFNFNELSSDKCRINCKSSLGNKRIVAADKRETTINSHTISSLNKVVKSSASSSNTSRDTSIESIVPKYKAFGLSATASQLSSDKDLTISPQKRSYNPKVLVNKNKFVVGTEKTTSNVVIPRIRSSINEKSRTRIVPVYRCFGDDVKGSFEGKAISFDTSSRNNNKENQRVPDRSNALSTQSGHYEDCDRDFFHRDPSNESLYIDFTKRRSPFTKSGHELTSKLAPLLPVNKERFQQRHNEISLSDYTYKFEVSQKQRNETSKDVCNGTSGISSYRGKLEGEDRGTVPSVFYVSCASWIPKCNNKFSIRERRLQEDSKTISRKR